MGPPTGTALQLPGRVARIGRQICMSLSEAHGQNIIHRDLKPANIFLCKFDGEEDFVKVMDFGIARVTEVGQEQNLTQTGMTQGTPAYMAPEQAMAKNTTPPADLYSLGCMLYQCLTGAQVFDEESALAISLAHVRDAPPKLVVPNCTEEVSEAWNDLIQLLLMKRPEQRPQTAREVADMLHQLELAGDGHTASSDVTVALQQTMPRPAITEADVGAMETAGAAGGTPAIEPSKGGFPWAIAAGVILVAGAGAFFALSGGEDDGANPSAETAENTTAQADTVKPAGGSEAGSNAGDKPQPEAKAAPEPKKVAQATLKLDTSPSGAQIFDKAGLLRCRTPCTIQSDPMSGPETWTAIKTGFNDTPFQVELKEGKESQQTVALVAAVAPAAAPVAAPAASKKRKRAKSSASKAKAQPAPSPPAKKTLPPPKKKKKPALPGFRKTKTKKALPKLRH